MSTHNIKDRIQNKDITKSVWVTNLYEKKKKENLHFGLLMCKKDK